MEWSLEQQMTTILKIGQMEDDDMDEGKLQLLVEGDSDNYLLPIIKTSVQMVANFFDRHAQRAQKKIRPKVKEMGSTPDHE